MNSMIKHLYDKGEKILVVMRGIPGSGKSYETNLVCKELNCDPTTNILSTDNYWIPKTLEARKAGQTVSKEQEKEEYRKTWNYGKLSNAHADTLNKFKEMIYREVNPVILDNTNIRRRDIKPYVDFAVRYNYNIFIKEPSSPWWQKYKPFLKNKNAPELEELAQELSSRNSHGVPIETIRKSIQRWDDIDLEDLIRN